jgi:SMI1/KNR4 family protein SUKH-1/HEAT repeat protein
MRHGRDPRALTALRDSARSDIVEIRSTAIQALGLLGEMSEVVEALRDDQPQVRASAAETLGYYSVLEPIDSAALEEALTDPDDTVRRAAKTALRRLGVQKTPRTRTKRATTKSIAASRVVCFAWEPLLNTWSQEWLNVREYTVEAPDEVIESGWLGYPGASEEQIAGAEQRLGTILPPSYREFLRVTNGWRRTSPFIEQIWPAEQIKPFAVENQEWIDIWREVDAESPEARYLPSAVQISEVGDAAVYLLMPELASEDNECEAWFLASWQGTAVRYKSFWDLMQAEYTSFKNMEKLGEI